MSHSIISDNWSLQNIGELLTGGIDENKSHYIAINKDKDHYSYEDSLSATINTEALFDFLTDIILRDQILVEEKFIHAWNHKNNPFQDAVSQGVIRPYPFLVDYKKLQGPRDEFINRLILTSDLKRDHEENRIGFRQHRHTPHGYLSQTLWGGAGMLARGFVYEKGYTPHPVRKRFFTDAGIMMSNEDSVLKLNHLVSEKRASIASLHSSGSELYALNVNMLPLPIRVIQESNSANDIIKIALQLRSEYQELRDWLNCYQQALSDGSYKDMIKFSKILKSISLYVDSTIGSVDSNAPTFTAGIGVLKVAIKGQPLNTLANQFGIRSMVNKLILSRSGTSDLRKYLGFFDHKNTVVGMKIVEHFSQKNA